MAEKSLEQLKSDVDSAKEAVAKAEGALKDAQKAFGDKLREYARLADIDLGGAAAKPKSSGSGKERPKPKAFLEERIGQKFSDIQKEWSETYPDSKADLKARFIDKGTFVLDGKRCLQNPG